MRNTNVAEESAVLVHEGEVRVVAFVGEGERGVDRCAGCQGESLWWIEVFDCCAAVSVEWRLRSGLRGGHFDDSSRGGSVSFPPSRA